MKKIKGQNYLIIKQHLLILQNLLMIKDLLLVGLGSGLGGMCRYLVSQLLVTTQNGFPWGTFTVNIVGSLLIGLLWGLSSRFPSLSPVLTLLFMVGFCGGFTTFSTFSREGLSLLQTQNYTLFLLYTLGSVVLGILAVMVGYFGGK